MCGLILRSNDEILGKQLTAGWDATISYVTLMYQSMFIYIYTCTLVIPLPNKEDLQCLNTPIVLSWDKIMITYTNIFYSRNMLEFTFFDSRIRCYNLVPQTSLENLL